MQNNSKSCIPTYLQVLKAKHLSWFKQWGAAKKGGSWKKEVKATSFSLTYDIACAQVTDWWSNLDQNQSY